MLLRRLSGPKVLDVFYPQFETTELKLVCLVHASAGKLIRYIHEKSSSKPQSIVVLLSFDETHTLSNEFTTEDDSAKIRSHYQVLCSALNYFFEFDIFTVHMSTNSNLAVYSPRAQGHWSARTTSTRIGKLQTPIVEMPFDMSSDEHLAIEGKHTAADVCQDEFMVRFGRMMYVLWFSVASVGF